MSSVTVYYGTFVHSLNLKELEIIENGVMAVNDEGNIVKVGRNVLNLEDFINENKLESAKVHKLGNEQFLIPGFVDTHAHAPQYMFAGSGMDLQLLEWLDEHVFPAESKFKETNHAKAAYTRVVQRFLANGTTTCSWFATIHLEACKALADIVETLGQRAYVGKVNMDQNAPDFYIEDTQSSLEHTSEFIEYVQSKKTNLVTPVITPRFAITCSTHLMTELSKLAEKYSVPTQTHLCENRDEIDFTCSLFKDSADYTSVYDDHKLLGEHSYMAHCVHMTDKEIDMLAERKTGIAHCANSNFSLHSGICDVRRFLDKNVKVGLGTDVAGGFSPSMLDAIRSSFFASKTQKMMHRDGPLQDKAYEPLTPNELLYLATMGGAEVLGLQEKIGNFEEGKAFDALWVDLEGGGVDLMGGESLRQKVEKFMFNGSDHNLKHVFVQGRRVAGRKE